MNRVHDPSPGGGDTHEVHFVLGAGVASELPRSRVVKRHRKGRGSRTQHQETYYDTTRLALRKSQVEVEVRLIDSKRTQVVRAPTGESERGKWKKKLGAGDPDFRGLDHFPKEFVRRGWDVRLEPIFTRHFQRVTFRLVNGDAKMDLAIDVGQARAVRRGGRPVSEDIREARLRLSSGSPERMMEVALELIESHDLILWHQLPVDRGYALVKPSLRPKASKAKALHLDRGMTVGEAFLASVEGALLHLFANEVPTLEGQPEGIHQSRVAIRRQRAVLRAFKNALPYGGRKAFNYEFRWFQKRMAPARDWHVFLDETIPRMILDGVDEALLEKLVRIARDERRWASLEAARSMSSRRFTRLLLQFERWLSLLQMPRPAGEFEEELLPFARGVLEKTHRDLLVDTRPLSRMSAADLHALRIRGKKARYAGEFFHTLFPPDRSRRQLAELAGLQDLLGEINDASVARLLLTTLKPERLSAETIEAIRDWSGQRVHSRARNAQSRWRRVQKAEPFWHQ